MKKMTNDNLYEWNLAITIHNDKIKNALKKKKENDLKHRKKMRTIENEKEAKYKATRKKTAQMRAQSVQHVSRLQNKHDLAMERWKRMSLEEDKIEQDL